MKPLVFQDTILRRRRYRDYLAYHRWRPHVVRRFTRIGVLVILSLMGTAVVGFDASQTLAYQSFMFLVFLALAGVAVCRLSRVTFEGRRNLPRYGSAGQPLSYTVLVKNTTSRRQEGLVLFEDVEPSLPGYHEYLLTPEPEEERRNFVDRYFGFYRWVWLVEQHDQGRIPMQTVPATLSRGETTVRFEFTPKRRGVVHFTGMTMGCTDAFGLFRSLVSIEAPQNLLILPKRYPLPSVPFPGAMKYQQGGVSLAASVGESEEFVSLRDYRPGDPMRHIHWKSWARTGRPIVKEFQEEFFVRHALVLDTFGDQPFSPVFEEAVSVAASFAATVERQDTLLDLMFVGPRAYCFTAGRGVAHTEQLLEILAGVTVCVDQPFETLTTMVLEHIASVSGCICVFIAWDEQRRTFVERMQGMGVPVLVLVVTPQGAERLDAGAVMSGQGAFHQLEAGKIADQLARL